MSFLRNFVRSELIDIIEWLDEGSDAMLYRFDRPDNEIKNGAQLIVRPSQVAVFVDQGRVADVFLPGRHELTTQNLPVLSTLRGWKYGFDSPFKAEVIFVSRRIFPNRKWGTKNPVMLRDAEFGPVRLRAFGNYSVRVEDAPKFVRDLVGTNPHFDIGQIHEQLRDLVVARFTDLLGESKIPVLDLAGNYSELGEFVTTRIRPDFQQYGLEITQVVVENISLPPEVEAALDRRTSMGIVGDLGRYTQFQTAEAIRAAADNPGGGASEGMGLGMGFAMANQMAQALRPVDTGAAGGASATPPAPPAPPAGPPPLPGATQVYLALDGQQRGPFGVEELRAHVADGRLTRETLVWRQGMPQWAPAADVPEVAALLSATPPPLG